MALALLLLATPASAEIISARFTAPTDRYDHGILGDAIEYGALELTLKNGQRLEFTLPQNRVFEDLAPRLADLNGDGRIELAYIEKPHLAKILRVWRLDGDTLHQIANLAGLTNHQIGQDFISGGIRECEGKIEMITVDANWTYVMATSLNSGRLTTKPLGSFKNQSSLKSVLNCKP